MIFNLKLRSCLLSALGGLILAFGLYNIHSVSSLTEGGLLGLTLFFEHYFSISPAVSSLILNVVCYIIGVRSLGPNFIGYSIFACGGFSFFYAIFEKFPRVFPGISEYPLLAAILGALFVGVGVGISIRAGGAPSGDDALAMSLSKLFRLKIKWIYLAGDISVLALSLTYIAPGTILYSLITVILSSLIVDFIHNAKTDKEDEISDPFGACRDVLVGTLRNREQLKASLENNFYHIPAIRLSSADFPLRYVAIYQSLHKFGDCPGVVYYGEIENYSLVKRSEITEIPRNSSEMYYRFDIKEWERLPSAILPDEGDFINLTTTLFLLTNSRTTSELCLERGEDLDLFRKIRTLFDGSASEILSSNGKNRIFTKNNKLVISRNGKNIFSLCIDEYKAHPLKSFRCLLREFDSE